MPPEALAFGCALLVRKHQQGGVLIYCHLLYVIMKYTATEKCCVVCFSDIHIVNEVWPTEKECGGYAERCSADSPTSFGKSLFPAMRRSGWNFTVILGAGEAPSGSD
jgi:hypothetical protein